MSGHNKAPVQYAGKPILLRGLITCLQCGCSVTGDIKKEKYVYYSCSNSKGICKKTWIREEKFLNTLLSHLDNIKLSDEQVERIIGYLKKTYAHEQEFFKQSQQALRKELDLIQGRLSKLIDMHLDGKVDSETYHTKLQEYKNRQREITTEMQTHVDIDEACLITAKTLFDLANRAKEIYESSNMDKKQQFLRFVYSNLKLNEKDLQVDFGSHF